MASTWRLVTLPNEQIESVISVKLATNDAPDIFFSNSPQTVEQYNATQTCVPLNDQPWASRLVAPDLLKYKGDGNIYAMPMRESSSFFGGIYYNKQYMEDLGIKDPNPKTMDEFFQLCQEIKDKGATPIYMTDKDGWCSQVWTTIGWGVALDDKKSTIYPDILSNKVNFQDIPEMVTVCSSSSRTCTRRATSTRTTCRRPMTPRRSPSPSARRSWPSRASGSPPT